MYDERKKKVLYYLVHVEWASMQHAEKSCIVQHHNMYTIHDRLWTTAATQYS